MVRGLDFLQEFPEVDLGYPYIYNPDVVPKEDGKVILIKIATAAQSDVVITDSALNMDLTQVLWTDPVGIDIYDFMPGVTKTLSGVITPSDTAFVTCTETDSNGQPMYQQLVNPTIVFPFI